MRVHFLVATLVMIVGWVLAIPRREFIAVLTAIMVVMVAEMVNTAIESVVDLASPDFHRLAQISKDVAAGSVLLASLGAALLGFWVFIPRIGRISVDFMLRLSESPGKTMVALIVLGLVVGLVIWIPTQQKRARRRP